MTSDVHVARDPAPRRRILLAEDDASLRSFLSEALTRAGFEVEEIDNGTALAARLKQVLLCHPGALRFDAIVSDLRMPGPSGMSLLRLLRMFDATMPFLLMTAYGDRGTHREAHSLGATAVFDKPLDSARLTRTLQGAFAPR